MNNEKSAAHKSNHKKNITEEKSTHIESICSALTQTNTKMIKRGSMIFFVYNVCVCGAAVAVATFSSSSFSSLFCAKLKTD